MVSLIVLLVLVATINMPQAAQACSGAGGPCDATTLCCSTIFYPQCDNNLCSGGTCQYSPAGCCVPLGGACSTVAQCCPGPIDGNFLICAANICSNILNDALNDLITINNAAGPIIGSSFADTLLNTGGSFLNAFGLSVHTTDVSRDDLNALGNITINNLFDIINIGTPDLTLSSPGTTLDTLPFSNFTRYINTLVAVANTQPDTTFSDIPGFATGNIGNLANITVSDYANVVANFITSLGNVENLVFADILTIINNANLGGLTLNTFFNFSNDFDLDLNDIMNRSKNIGDNLGDVFNSLRDNNTCTTDSDCCYGGTCSCCASVGRGGSHSCCGPVADALAGWDVLSISGNSLCSNLCPNFTTTTSTTATTTTTTTITATTTTYTQTATSTCKCLPSAGLMAMSTYNVIVLKNLTTSSSIDLTTIICASLVQQNSATFGSQLTTQNFPASSYSLVINQTIAAQNGINVQIGSVGFGCNPSHTIVKQSNQYIVNGNSRINLNDNRAAVAVVQNCTVAATCQSVAAGVQDLSTALSLLPLDSMNNFTFNYQQNTLKVNVNVVDCNGIAVFNLSASAVFGQQNLQIQIFNNTPAINLVVINLSGGSAALLSSVHMSGNWLGSNYGRARTIWNLYQASTLELGSTVYGALLAPKATVSPTTNQAIYGVTVLNSFTTNGGVKQPYIVYPPSLYVCD